MKAIKLNKWNDYIFYLKDDYISSTSLHRALSKFWNDLWSELKENYYIQAQCKVGFKFGTKSSYLSISYVQTFNKYDFDEIFNSFVEYLNDRIDNHSISGREVKDINRIIFTYKIYPSNIKIEQSMIHYPDNLLKIDGNDKKTYKKYGLNLPSTMDIETWGDIETMNDNEIIIKKNNSQAKYFIKLFDDRMIVECKMNDRTLYEFVDYPDRKSESPLKNFMRKFKYDNKYFEEGKEYLHTTNKTSNFLKKTKRSEKMTKSFIILDLETRGIDGYMWPYCSSIYDGITLKTFYLLDYNDNKNDMIDETLQYLMRKKYNNHKVFVHNFSCFDIIFLLNSMKKLGDNIKPILRNSRFIKTKFYFYKKYSLTFIDSLLLLPISLDKLAKGFETEYKGIYPYKFLTDMHKKNIGLDYIGRVPRFKFFDLKNKSYSDYINYISQFKHKLWNLREETIKYSELDVKILYNILKKFNEKIFKKFGVNALNYPTISSLAFAIYRKNYLKDNKIPLIGGKIYNDLKPSFTGGACDVYKPYSYNKKINCYDVNSLYPFVMKNEMMPVGPPTFFEGDINKIEQNPFGFFEVEVKAPDNLYSPLLQTKCKTENGIRTIAPVGTWIGTYFSEELKEAEKLGYSFKILRGYLFDKENIFENYVTDLYDLKSQSEKDSADYIIYKLLLNSLYGRFGMSPIKESHIIIDGNEATKKYHTNNNIIVTNIINLENNNELISFFEKTQFKDESEKIEISIPIASAITSYGRIYMSKFKNLYQNNLYYSDTDSLYLDISLDYKYLSKDEIGKFKLERIFNNALFLSPKMYSGRYLDEYGKMQHLTKIKGVKIDVSFSKLIPLLYENKHINIVQEKWFRNIQKSTIKIDSESKYTMKISSFKRNIIYKNKIFVETKPLKLNDGI